MTLAILGAGIGGLSAGYYAIKKQIKPVAIYEASNRIGGWIKTERNKNNNFVFEQGPRTIRPKGPAANNTLDLIEDLGLDAEVQPILSNHVAAKNRMIFAKNKLCLLPSDILGVLKTMPPFSKPLFTAGIKDLFTGRSKVKLEDETMYSFVERRFGKELADYAISSMLCGICAGDAKEISVKFLIKDIFEMEQRRGGVLKGFLLDKLFSRKKPSNLLLKPKSELAERAKNEGWSIYSLKGGLELLPKYLGTMLKENIKLNANADEVTFKNNKIELSLNGKKELYDSLVSSIPSNKLSKLVKKQHPKLSNQLEKIPFVDVCVINLQYDKPNLQKHCGFGFLVPPIENLPILGVIFDSCCFDMGQNTVLTVMMGGKWFRERFGENPREDFLLETALKHVNKILEIDEAPTSFKVNILRDCIPQYIVGHHKVVQDIRNYISEHNLPLTLCGSSYDGVGVNDVILSARKAVDYL